MSKSAYIKLVDASKQTEITLEEVKELLHYYQDITSKTGEQLNWEYENHAFPYEIIQKSEGKDCWFYLKGHDPKLYKYIVIGIGQEEAQVNDEMKHRHFIQVVLPEDATQGDNGKANELCKFLAKKLNAELHLFNGRVMYYYKRK